MEEHIYIKGAQQNNLKGFDLQLPLHKLIVVTGVSGSGKSSLAFDTVYSEGQRRYFETFSAYTRQFLDRMDKPQVDRIEGIPPSIAIDQNNPVRTSRSTVGTMTELNDHLKLLFAKAGQLYCRSCGREVQRDSPDTVFDALASHDGITAGTRLIITFPITIPHNFSADEIKEVLQSQGYQRIFNEDETLIQVIQDRTKFSKDKRGRITEDIEKCFHHGGGKATVHIVDKAEQVHESLKFSSGLHCAHCDIQYSEPIPNMFSFNSPIGACTTCRGFGRTIGIDYDLVIPDKNKSIEEGAIKPFQSQSYEVCQRELMQFAPYRGIRTGIPWNKLSNEEKQWIIEGEGDWDEGVWYGIERFFQWLESKSYKMHIRVLLSKYRTYHLCHACHGARLKPESLLWRVGGKNLWEIVQMPISECNRFFQQLELPAHLDEAAAIVLEEIRSRLHYLNEVGVGYLTLDRQSRTLSGGEVQRINLTTALGTSLVNTLFVLDEPSIGLHSRDIRRLIRILTRLRDSGNTLLVVEHDPEVIMAADIVVDLGPAAGEAGGEVRFIGTPKELLRSGRTLTADYLSGRKSVISSGEQVESREAAAQEVISIVGAAEHNLQKIDVDIPLDSFVCISGVSGSGKSTLIQDVLYMAVRKLKQRPIEQPGAHEAVYGHDLIDDIVLVDQSPIGKTARSNPVSYVGALDPIRSLFAKEPLAKQRGYSAGTFSFNSPKGRCPTCGGSGFEHIEMQFLSDVYIRCPDCHGTRYRPEVLEVKLLPEHDSKPRSQRPASPRSAQSIADVLEMTVDEACTFFSSEPRVLNKLEPLRAVGLGYLRLGQPLPTLSGGESQRLKLAGHLAVTNAHSRKNQGRILFLFDEPTTGLHFDDIATLLNAFRQLIRAGHSLVVIEHNLDVLRASDWIIELGPEGGGAGGQVVFTGRPDQIVSEENSHTGRALQQYNTEGLGPASLDGAAPATAAVSSAPENLITLSGAREHNLKNIELTIPLNTFTVITGVSGSGKSTIAFDILFNEGQRRYLESLNAYARQFVQPAARPEVDSVAGVPPTVAIEQRTSRGGWKSTVATVTELYHFIRLLFLRLGIQHCPDCGVPIQSQTVDQIVQQILRDYRDIEIEVAAPLVLARKGYYTDLAAWAAGKGYSHLRVDGELLPTEHWPRLDRYQEHTIQMPVNQILVDPSNEQRLREALELALQLGKNSVHIIRPGNSREEPSPPEVFSTERACPSCGRSFAELDPRLFSYNSHHGWCPACNGTGFKSAGEDSGPEVDSLEPEVCPRCEGDRLRPEALAVQFEQQSIADFNRMTVSQARHFFEQYQPDGRSAEIARDAVEELKTRLSFLEQVGLGYLSLDRSAPTLSGGEAQRIRLAAQLGSNLRGVCYILDEPTIGLHPRDNRMLMDTLQMLKQKGNSVVVVEHDEETIRAADHVIDIGPGGGVHGGNVVFTGTVPQLLESSDSPTGHWLKHPLRHPLTPERRRLTTPAVDQSTGSGTAAATTAAEGSATAEPAAATAERKLALHGVHAHNLKDIDIELPVGKLIAITGVSGSGKSTLARDVLFRNVYGKLKLKKGSRKKSRRTKNAGPQATASRSAGPRSVYPHSADQRSAGAHDKSCTGCRGIEGVEYFSRALEVDQTPIGKTPRSCPATYVGFWDHIRTLFASTPEAKVRGYSASRFSFNVAGGRCEECSGQGVKRIEMNFLPDVTIPCEVCGGRRFNHETLEVTYKDKTIADVLQMSVEEAVDFFQAIPAVHRPLALLNDIGLGYLTLGQQSPTLSGGEAQRLKLVSELSKAKPGSATMETLYILDEPTVGLHMADVEKLLRVLHRLVDAGNTIVIIEHNLDIIAEADWIVDLGPEGGSAGGEVVASGTPEQITSGNRRGYTAALLREFLQERLAAEDQTAE